MNCEQVQPNLLDYGRNLLSGTEHEQIKAHLADCIECAEVLREEMTCFQKLAAVPDAEPRNDVWALVRSRAKYSRIRPLVWLHGLVSTNLRKTATATVALAIIAVAFYNIMLVNPQPQPTNTYQPVVAVYSDDPIGGHTDAIIDSIDDM